MRKKRKLDQHEERGQSKRSCQVNTTHGLGNLEKKLLSTKFSPKISIESRLDKGLNGIFCDVSGTNDIVPVIQLIGRISNHQVAPVLILTSEKRKRSWYLECRSQLESSSFLTVPYWGKSSRDRSELRCRLLINKQGLTRIPIFVSSFELWTQDEHLLCQSEWNAVVFDFTETNNIANIMKRFFSGQVILPTKHALLMTSVSPDQMTFEMLWSMVRFSIPFWSGRKQIDIIDAETEKTLQRDSLDVVSNWKDKEIGILEKMWRNVLSHLIVERSIGSRHNMKLVDVSYELSRIQNILLERLQRDISLPIHELLATWRKVCMLNGSFDEKEDILSEEPTLNLLSMRKIREILDIVRKVSTHPDLYIKDQVRMPLYLCDMTLFQLPNWIEDETDDKRLVVPVHRSMFRPYIVPDRVIITDHHYSMPKQSFAGRLLAMFPIDIFMRLERPRLRLIHSSLPCWCLVDLPANLGILRSIYMSRTVAPSRELKISSSSQSSTRSRCELPCLLTELPVMNIQIRNRKEFMSQSGKFRALDVLLRTLVKGFRTKKVSSRNVVVVVLVEDNETLQMLDEYLRYNKSYFAHTCLPNERVCDVKHTKSLQDCNKGIILTSMEAMERMNCASLHVGAIVDFDSICGTKKLNEINKFFSRGRHRKDDNPEHIKIYQFVSKDKRINAAKRVLNRIHSSSSISMTTRVSEIWGDLSELLI